MGLRGNWIEVAPPDAQTCLVLYPRTLMPSWEQVKPSVVFNCDDAHATCEALAAKGVQIYSEPST